MKLSTKLSSFLSNSSGNMAIMTALTLPVFLMAIGAAVSINDAHNRKSELQSNADIMSLAMAKRRLEFTDSEARAYFNEYMLSQMEPGEDCTFKMKNNGQEGFAEATVDCSGEIPSFLAGFLKKKTVPYAVTSTAVLESNNTYEVAFVFDISLSMDGDEIEDLKKSLISITDSALFDAEDSRISLIPFANTVRLGTKLENFVTPGTGYNEAGGVYNGCFNRDATDPEINLKSNPTFPLVRNTLNSGKVVCQDETMTAIFHEKATEWVVKDMASDITTAFGTGMSDALVWGFRSLDSGLRGVMSSSSNYPLAKGKSSKHIIMMTDGRPYDRPWSGPGGGAFTQKLSLDRFESVCAELPFAASDISFHLINYNNKSLSPEHLAVFKGCVTGDGEFHDVASGSLNSVINEITDKVSSLRLSQ